MVVLSRKGSMRMLCGRKIHKLLHGEYAPRAIAIRGRALFGGQASATHQPPSLLPPAAMQAKVKQEQLEHSSSN